MLPRDSWQLGFAVPWAPSQAVSWNLSPFSPITQNREFILFSSWGFIWQGIFMALLGSRSQTLDDSQKRGCGLFKRYLKSGSYNVWRRSKQASARLMAVRHGSLEWPHNAWGRLSWGYKCKPEKEGQLSKQENLQCQSKPHLQRPEGRCERKRA